MKHQQRMYRISTAALGLTAMAAGLLAQYIPWLAPAQDSPVLRTVEQAQEATAQALASNSARPTDPVTFQETVEALWPYLHPEVVESLRANDSDYLANHLTASIQILQTDELTAEAEKDPAYLAARDAVQRAFDQKCVDPREAEDRVLRQAELVRKREAARRLSETSDTASEGSAN